MMDEGAECVYEALNLEQAHVIRGRLEASGIPSYLEGRGLGAGMFSGLGRVRVMVPRRFAEKARWVLSHS